jgi:hypothetical protein
MSNEIIEALTDSVIRQDKELKNVARLLKKVQKNFSHDKATDIQISKAIRAITSGNYLVKKV